MLMITLLFTFWLAYQRHRVEVYTRAFAEGWISKSTAEPCAY